MVPPGTEPGWTPLLETVEHSVQQLDIEQCAGQPDIELEAVDLQEDIEPGQKVAGGSLRCSLADTESELTDWVTDTVLEQSGWLDGIGPAKSFCQLDIGHLQLSSSAGIDPWAGPELLAGTADVPEQVCLRFVDVVESVSVEFVVAVEAAVVVEYVFAANVDNAAAAVVGVVVAAVVIVGVGFAVAVVAVVAGVDAVVVAAAVAGVVVAAAAVADAAASVVFVGWVDVVVAVVSVDAALFVAARVEHVVAVVAVDVEPVVVESAESGCVAVVVAAAVAGVVVGVVAVAVAVAEVAVVVAAAAAGVAGP